MSDANPGGVNFREVASADAARLNALFDAAECGCHCRYWHFAGDKNAWLERLAQDPARNGAELSHDLAIPELGPHGTVALLQDRIVGWMKLTRAERVQKLYEQRPYRGLDCFGGDRSRVLTIGCILVDPAFRRSGVARGLLAAALEAARGAGATSIEAFPRNGRELADAEAWMGPAALFESAGFRTVRAVGPYPVLRKVL